MTTVTATRTTRNSSYITQMQFAHALAIVRAIPQNSSLQPVTAADKLQFYGLYKQATEGNVNIPRPSSRQVVDYAKWKAWSRMKGMTPIEAQKLYVDSLIQLLTELVHRYPRHEQTAFLKKALDSLEFDHNEEQESEQEELFQDAYDDTEFELQEHFLNHIEPEHIMDQQDILLNSPPPITLLSASFHSTSTPNHHQRGKNYRQNSFSDVMNTTEYPITPITSPGGGQNSVTGQWVLNQLQQHNSNKSYIHPMDFLQQQQQQQDVISEADTCDREVAAATANLILSSPRQSPYTSSTSHHKKHQHSPHLSSTSTTTASSSKSHVAAVAPLSSSQPQKKVKRSSVDTRALEKLQTEVTALTEQIDRMRRESIDQRKSNKQIQWKTVLKTVIKYLMINSAILFIVFYILWKKKSPIAYKIINAIMPYIQLVIRKIIRRVVFWKITV